MNSLSIKKHRIPKGARHDPAPHTRRRGRGGSWLRLAQTGRLFDRCLPVDKQSGHQHSLRHGRGRVDGRQFSLNSTKRNFHYEKRTYHSHVCRHAHSYEPGTRALSQSELAVAHGICRLQFAAIVVHKILSARNHPEKTWRGRLMLLIVGHSTPSSGSSASARRRGARREMDL